MVMRNTQNSRDIRRWYEERATNRAWLEELRVAKKKEKRVGNERYAAYRRLN
jgi:hypothetical protein